MDSPNKLKILSNIQSNLNRKLDDIIPPVPPPLPPRQIENLDNEIDTLLKEINALSGSARRVTSGEIEQVLTSLVESEGIQKALLWETPYLNSLKIKDVLIKNGIEVIPNGSKKQSLAECDLGITEVDFALAETGTLCLVSASDKPRTASLLPRIHLALVKPENLRPDIHQVVAEAKGEAYFVFITGPSRTADIELTVALGVHGPQKLYAWVMV